jgi:TolA-binding protein
MSGRLRQVFMCAMAAGALVLPAAGDTIRTRTGTETGEILRVLPDGSMVLKVVIGTGTAEKTIARRDIVSVDVPQPPAVPQAQEALRAKKYGDAIALLKPLVDRYAGAPVPWVQQAMDDMGAAFLGQKDFNGAKAVFDRIKAVYPNMAGLDVKYARIQVAQKEYDKALPVLEAFIEPMRKKLALSDEEETAMAEALVMVGDCRRAKKDLEGALDHYLEVVVLHDLDADVAAEAKLKAAEIFEELGNIKRARGSYEELIADDPNPHAVEKAKKRLASLKKD